MTRQPEFNWIRCKGCGHKLMRVITAKGTETEVRLEIKCHSCKTLNTINFIKEKKV